MTEQIIVNQNEVTHLEPSPAPAKPKAKQPRQLVRFTFYKLDPQWQLLPIEQRQQGKQELLALYEVHGQQSLLRSFGLYGLRTDCDFMLWQATYDIDDLQGLSSKIRRSLIGPYLRETQSMLSMTKRSVYVGKHTRGHDPRLVITPDDKKYLFVYPFVKTRAWHALPLADRQRMMNEHFKVGFTYPSMTLNSPYPLRLDDLAVGVAFKTDNSI